VKLWTGDPKEKKKNVVITRTVPTIKNKAGKSSGVPMGEKQLRKGESSGVLHLGD